MPSTSLVYQAEAMVRVLEPLVEAAVAPPRAELADTRGALETARQELGAALERIRMLEAVSTGQDAPDAAQDALQAEIGQSGSGAIRATPALVGVLAGLTACRWTPRLLG